MNGSGVRRPKRAARVGREMRKHKALYFMLLPGLIFFLVYRYIPMYGIVIAFKKFSIGRGIWGSKWVGLENFMDFFTSPVFDMVMMNTVLTACISWFSVSLRPSCSRSCSTRCAADAFRRRCRRLVCRLISSPG